MGKRKQWSRLDNAAKIFPPTSSKWGTKVFRFVCELIEPVDSVETSVIFLSALLLFERKMLWAEIQRRLHL